MRTMTNFITTAIIMMEEYAAKLDSGEIRLGFGNQFNGIAIENALHVLKNRPEAVERHYNELNHLTEIPIIELAYRLDQTARDEVFESMGAWVN